MKYIFNIVQGILFPYLLTHIYNSARFPPGVVHLSSFSSSNSFQACISAKKFSYIAINILHVKINDRLRKGRKCDQ
jgi:hypothetical protein